MKATSDNSLDIIRSFTRKIPSSPRYVERLKRELDLIENLNFSKPFLQVSRILALARNIPHLTRGSAGSSLVCYLMGISDIDPIKENISFIRFMNPLRTDIPDIDIDFPYNRREEVYQKVYKYWPNRVARISNNVTFQQRSALREAIRRLGYTKFLPRNFELKDLPLDEEKVLDLAKGLEGKKKNTSLHCGGIIIFDEKVPEEIKIKENQISWDKNDVENRNLFKIDILSNRGLAQIADIDRKPLAKYPEKDALTSHLIARGDVVGITYGESPAFKKIVTALKPNSRSEIILALALIRPAPASRGGKKEFLMDWYEKRSSKKAVFEDDITRLIQKVTGCNEAESDMWRRAFAKGDEQKIAKFTSLLSNHSLKKKILEDLHQSNEYSFCKAHAISYGRLIWALAYQKAHSPKTFWWSTLNHAYSMYRPWVHIEEAKKCGWNIPWGPKPWFINGLELRSLSSHPGPSYEDPFVQYIRKKYWTGNGFLPGMYLTKGTNSYFFRGLIASSRSFSLNSKNLTFITIGVEGSLDHFQLIDLTIDGNVDCSHFDVIEGEGVTDSNADAFSLIVKKQPLFLKI